MRAEQGWPDTFYVHQILTLSDKSHTSQIALNPSILAGVELDALDSSGCLGLTKSSHKRISHTDYDGDPVQNNNILQAARQRVV